MKMIAMSETISNTKPTAPAPGAEVQVRQLPPPPPPPFFAERGPGWGIPAQQQPVNAPRPAAAPVQLRSQAQSPATVQPYSVPTQNITKEDYRVRRALDTIPETLAKTTCGTCQAWNSIIRSQPAPAQPSKLGSIGKKMFGWSTGITVAGFVAEYLLVGVNLPLAFAAGGIAGIAGIFILPGVILWAVGHYTSHKSNTGPHPGTEIARLNLATHIYNEHEDTYNVNPFNGAVAPA